MAIRPSMLSHCSILGAGVFAPTVHNYDLVGEPLRFKLDGVTDTNTATSMRKTIPQSRRL